MYSLLLILFPLVGYTQAQQIGTNTAEVHPALTWQTCTAPGSCTAVNGKIVLDSNWRWLHSSTGTNCYTGNTWDATLCPSNTACAANCQLDGANYASTYGITTTGSSLRLNFVTSSSTKNIGSRVYLMADDDNYKTFNMLNQELAFDVDVSHLPCGISFILPHTSSSLTKTLQESMEHFTLPECKPMEARQPILETRPELDMVLDTVMLNVLEI